MDKRDLLIKTPVYLRRRGLLLLFVGSICCSACTRPCVCVCKCVCSVCVCKCVCKHLHTGIHTYMHTCTYNTHTHMHTCTHRHTHTSARKGANALREHSLAGLRSSFLLGRLLRRDKCQKSPTIQRKEPYCASS
jgi:hypothetical protein